MRALRLLVFSASAAVLLGSHSWAQPNVIQNGSFEKTLQTPNFWSGTDHDGNLIGFRDAAPVLNSNGSISETPMPISVALGDLNRDGLLDIVAADPLGYIRIYFNSGSKESPKFTYGEFSLPFLALGDGEPPWTLITGRSRSIWREMWEKRRRVVRISLVDLSNTGKLDIVAGNYFGDLFLIRNNGTPNAPRYDQPQPLSRVMLTTSKDPNRRWGNVFAPLMHDWNNDGRADLLVGEGSFSANSIHLLLNEGSSMSPSFNDEKRQPLAIGEGRRQLTPTLTDFDGDGKIDILVTDAEGHITIYLRPDNWKPGDVILPTGYLAKAGGLTQKTPEDPSKEKAQAYSLGSGINTISAGDLNNDGLFDLIIGRTSGRVAWAHNTGTKEKPKFETPKDLVGSKPTPATWLNPSQWDISTGSNRGNFYAYATVVDNEDDPDANPQDGSKALKFGYATPANTVVPRPSINMPVVRNTNRKSDDLNFNFQGAPNSAQRSQGKPVNFFVMRQVKFELLIGKTYSLSFKVRGTKISDANAVLAWRGLKVLDAGRKVVGERGAVKTVGREGISENNEVIIPFNPTPAWSTISRDIKIEFVKNKELNEEEKTSQSVFDISFNLAAPDGFLYIDDVRLTPKN